MIQEIVYTSAPKGLRRGSHGFCTVVSSAGMDVSLAERLESMSGYRYAFPLSDPAFDQNPVNYAHVTTRLAGRTLHVLSRIAAAGQDYSGRTNKLAHHIVVDESGRHPVGPARILDHPDNMVAQWDGRVRTQPPRSLVPPVPPKTCRAETWRALSGDEGWAGSVAEQLLSGRAAVVVIFPAGADTLALVREVLDVVPAENRWNITFSTYFTRLLAGTECQLRFVLDGTAEASTARHDARTTVVDLVADLPPASGGPLVQKARSGDLRVDLPESPTAQDPSGATQPSASALSDGELERLLDEESAAARDGDLPGNPFPAPADSHRPGVDFPSALPPAARAFGSGHRRRSPIVAVCVLVICVVVAAAVAFWALLRSPRVEPSELPQANAVNDTPHSGDPADDATADDENDVQPGVDSSAAEQTDEMQQETPEPEPKPAFAGRKPFELMRKDDGRGNEQTTWSIPDRASGAVSDCQKFDLSPATHTVTVDVIDDKLTVAPQDGNGKSATDIQQRWKVLHGDVIVGHFSLSSSGPEEQSEMTWKWDDSITAATDPMDICAEAARRLVNSSIRVSASPISDLFEEDAITLKLAEGQHAPFRHFDAQTDNRGQTLGIPRYEPGVARKTRLSGEMYIEVASVEDIELSVVGGFNAVVPQYDVFITREVNSDKSRQRWHAGLGFKGQSPDDVSNLGTYIVEMQGDYLASIRFEWLDAINAEDSRHVQWAPVRITVDEEQTVLFSTQPETVRPLSLKDFSQSVSPDLYVHERKRDASGRDRRALCPLPLVNGTPGQVQLTRKDSTPVATLPFGRPQQNQSGTTAAGKNDVGGPRDPNSGGSAPAFYLMLTRPAKFVEEDPVNTPEVLGHGAFFIASPVYDENSLSLKMSARVEASFNRMERQYAGAFSIPRLAEDRFWPDEEFDAEVYTAEVKAAAAKIRELKSLVGAVHRLGEGLPFTSFEKVRPSVVETHKRLQGRISQIDTDLVKSKNELTEMKKEATDVNRIIEARSRPDVTEAMEELSTDLSDLIEVYSPEQISHDKDTVQEALTTIAETTLHYALSVQIPDGDQMLTLYLLTSQQEASNDD